MNTILRKTLALLLVSGSLVAHAQDAQKFGYVNPVRVYTETQKAKSIEASLQKEFGAQQKKLAQLQTQGIKLQEQLQSGKLTGDKAKETEAKLVDISRQYRVAAAQLAEEYNLRRNEEFAALQNNANHVIKNIAEQEKYDLIVQEAVFVSGKYDITDRVIRLLDNMK
ncbi:MAG: OmpH family outer membrane protein [Alysiella sp.]|uniref:OmpH family outer membrane protein n=1 Tax=Alysiella sp. TaxID=1872483 RepID=UPI0026DB81C8|nr:OmpH family outer membrane protein [Alysiella sp.]MDO4433140.1 OmpH family outer membrane protein [Alysiella sp.]